MSHDPKPDFALPATQLGHSPSPHTGSGAVLAAEGVGTFVFVFATVGAALFTSTLAANGFIPPGIAYLAVAAVAGLSLMVVTATFGPVSGGHFNPAVSVGLAAAGRVSWRRVPALVAAQVIGALVASSTILLIGIFAPAGWLDVVQAAGFGSSGWGAASPAGFGMVAVMLVQTILCALLTFVFLGITHDTRGNPLAPFIIGAMIAVLSLVSLLIDNGGYNPAKAIATAMYGGGTALVQVWVFVVFPCLGAALAGVTFRALFASPKSQPVA